MDFMKRLAAHKSSLNHERYKQRLATIPRAQRNADQREFRGARVAAHNALVTSSPDCQATFARLAEAIAKIGCWPNLLRSLFVATDAYTQNVEGEFQMEFSLPSESCFYIEMAIRIIAFSVLSEVEFRDSIEYVNELQERGNTETLSLFGSDFGSLLQSDTEEVVVIPNEALKEHFGKGGRTIDLYRSELRATFAWYSQRGGATNGERIFDEVESVLVDHAIFVDKKIVEPDFRTLLISGA